MLTMTVVLVIQCYISHWKTPTLESCV